MIAPSNLRDRMRQDSRRVHRELDASLGRFDLREPADLTAFFRILERGYAALGTGRGAGAKLAADLARHLRADLAVLGASPLPAAPALPPDAESLAIDYVVLGSQLGSAVLKREWEKSTNPTVRRADNYFSAPPQSEGWAEFCAQTRGMPATGDMPNRAQEDISRFFGLFSTGIDLISETTD